MALLIVTSNGTRTVQEIRRGKLLTVRLEEDSCLPQRLSEDFRASSASDAPCARDRLGRWKWQKPLTMRKTGYTCAPSWHRPSTSTWTHPRARTIHLDRQKGHLMRGTRTAMMNSHGSRTTLKTRTFTRSMPTSWSGLSFCSELPGLELIRILS